MKCATCGLIIDSIDEAIDRGWIPYAWDADREQDGPFCTSCTDSLITIDENGEFVIKEEYQGKLTYQDGDFSEVERNEHLVIGIMLSQIDEEIVH